MSEPMHRTSVLVSPKFYKLCKEHGIQFSEALRVGISILLAEKGITEYDNKLNLVRMFTEMQKKAGEYAQKAANLENGKDKP